ncbi:MAG: hypothetical protein RLZ57_837 [Actinomycetota bacterium]|jgi:diacylglycerol kinase (ATP)
MIDAKMWLVAVNPTSGQGQGAVIAQEVTNYLAAQNQEYRLITGINAQNLNRNLKASANSDDKIIAVGGDGLIHNVLQIAVPLKLPILAIPAGTGNDFVRSLGWDLSHRLEMIWHAINHPPIAIDLGCVDGEYFGAVLSTGFDSIVNERANRLKWPTGPQKYNLSIALELPSFKPKRYEIELDGRKLVREAMLIAIGNGSSYGGGMKVCPSARNDDGLFEIMILNPISKFEFIRVFPTVYNGEHVKHPKVEMFQAKSVSVSSDAIAYADGERIGPLPITASVTSKCLKTWTA